MLVIITTMKVSKAKCWCVWGWGETGRNQARYAFVLCLLVKYLVSLPPLGFQFTHPQNEKVELDDS